MHLTGRESAIFSSNPFASQYKAKLCDADDAVATIGDDSLLIHWRHAGGTACRALGLGHAAAHRRSEEAPDLRGAGSPHSLDSVLTLDLADCVERESFFVAGDRGRVQVGLNYFVPTHFHQLPRLIEEHMQVDVAATVVSPMDRAGYFTFGVVNDFISTAARCAKRLIVEVNESMPRVHGNSRLHISQVTHVVENHCG